MTLIFCYKAFLDFQSGSDYTFHNPRYILKMFNQECRNKLACYIPYIPYVCYKIECLIKKVA